MAPDILTELRAAGITLSVDGGNLVATPKAAITDELRSLIRTHKAELVAALAAADDGALWWRVSILEPGGRTVETDTPSGWTLADWQAYAERYHGPGYDVRPIGQLPEPRAPASLAEALAAACDGVAITPAQFRALLSAEDIEDIEAGAIHPKTLKAYAESFAARQAQPDLSR